MPRDQDLGYRGNEIVVQPDDYNERVRYTLEQIAPTLNALPEYARALVVERVKADAAKRQDFVTRAKRTAVGAAKAIPGAVLGASKAMAPLGIGTTDPETGMDINHGITAARDANAAEWSTKQQQYEAEDESRAGSRPFLTNMQEGAANMWEGLVGLPGVLEQSEREGTAFETGQAIGDAVVRDTAYLATSPIDASYNDPTRILDLATGTKAAGAGAKAAKFALKGKGFRKAANVAGVAGEFLDPTPDTSRVATAGKKKAPALAEMEAAAKGPVADAGEAARAGLERPVRAETPELADQLELSRAEKAAAYAGKAARSGLMFGALASDVVNPIGAMAIGAAAPFAGKAIGLGARELAKASAKRKHKVSLSNEEASMAAFRAVADPNAQVMPSSQQAVHDVAVDPIHGRQAIETTSMPLAHAAGEGDLRLRPVDPENPDTFDREGIRYDYLQWNNDPKHGGRLEANAEGVDAAREAFTKAGVAERTFREARLGSRAANRTLMDAVGPLSDDAKKQALSARAKEMSRLSAEDDLRAIDKSLEQQPDPTRQAVAAKEAALAGMNEQKLYSMLSIGEKLDRELAVARGAKPQSRLGTRTKRLRLAEAKLAADKKRIAAIEQKAAALGPESAELIEEARNSARKAIYAQSHLDALMSKASPAEKKRRQGLLRRIASAEDKASRSAAFLRVADRDIRLAKEAALAWTEGAPVTAEVLVGLSLIRREAVQASKSILDVSEKLHQLDRSRGKGGWNLREANREITARANAKKLDMAFKKAFSDHIAVEELRGKVGEFSEAKVLREFDALREAQSMLDVIPRKERLLGEAMTSGQLDVNASQRAVDKFSGDINAQLLRDAQLASEAAMQASRASRMGPGRKVRRLTKDEARFVKTSVMKAEVEHLLAGLQTDLAEMVSNPAYQEAVAAGAAARRKAKTKAEALGLTREARAHLGAKRPEGEPAMQRGGQRVFAKLDEDSLGSLAETAAAISELVREMPDIDVNKVLARSLSRSSMIHAMNKRLLGWVSDKFYERLVASGVTPEAIRMTDAYQAQKGKVEIRKGLAAKQFIRRQLEETVVERIQKSDLLAGSEPHILIDLPDGSVFDVGEHIYQAFDALQKDKKVLPGELIKESAEAAFGKMARTYLERKTQMAVANEVARSADIVTDAAGNIAPPAAQMSAFVATYNRGAPGNIVLFDTSNGSAGLQQAIGGSFETVAADALAKYGEVITQEDWMRAKTDLQTHFMPAPESLKNAIASGLAEMGVGLPGDVDIHVRFGYGQSVSTHLDYLNALDQVGNWFVEGLKAMKRGLTVGSTGAVMANMASNVVLLSVMTGRVDIMNQLAKEAQRLRQYEVNGAKFGPGTEVGRRTAALLSTGIGDSSMAHEFGKSKISPGSTKGLVRSAWDAYWNFRVGAYKQVDSLPKLLLSRMQLDELMKDIDSLKPNQIMSLEQGGSSRSVLFRDESGNLRLNGDILSDDQVLRIAAKQATRSAANVLFDFNETGLLLKSLTKSSMPSIFNELGAWFLKALEMPGRQGIVSSAAFFDPSSSYVTNSPHLLAKKAASFARLAVRRQALTAAAREVGNLGSRNISSMLGWQPGSTLLVSPNDAGDGRDINIADMTSANWMTPLLTQAEGVAMVAGAVGDLFNSTLGYDKGYTEAEMAVMAAHQLGGRRFRDYRGLSEEARNRAILIDRRIQRQYEIATGKRDFVSSLMEMTQLTGGLFGDAAKLDDFSWGAKGAMKMLQALLGGDSVHALGLRQDQEDMTRADPEEWTEGQENFFRAAMAGMFRFVGRSRNSVKEINKRVAIEKSAIRKRGKAMFKGLHPDDAILRRKFLEAMVDEAADKARAEVEDKVWAGM